MASSQLPWTASSTSRSRQRLKGLWRVCRGLLGGYDKGYYKGYYKGSFKGSIRVTIRVPILGGSRVVMSRVISRVTTLITHSSRRLISPFLTTHETSK